MIKAFIISLVIAIPMALLSCFLVVKDWSLIGDAISHATFPGIVIAYILGYPYSLGAFIAGLFSAIGTGLLKENTRIKQDTAMGILFASLFALGIVLSVNIRPDIHLDDILFGDVLGISLNDIQFTSILAILITAIFIIKWKDFLVYSFDPAQAKALGISIKWLHYGFLSLISLTIISALQAVGIILSIALLIAPGAISLLLTKKFTEMLCLALGISILSSFSGVYLSFFLNSASAPTIVLCFASLFLSAFLYRNIKSK
jgi:manganese/iron transport system permease protein